MSLPHDAIENLPSEPPTPTISNISSSDMSFEEISAMSDTSSAKEPENDLDEHPTLYIREDMVKIRVQRTLFRIPLYFLTQESAHFTKCFEDQDLANIVHITDDDVTSSAFANFLQVLRPPLGVTPISTIAQWTDVLHLSTKWGFADLRAAAIKAILPLASAVHKIVLGRTYGFSDWIPHAFADILEREEDLTLEEAEMMPLKDVVAIAKGRREAIQTKKMKPRKEIEEIVKGLLPSTDDTETPHTVPPSCATDSSATQLTPSADIPPTKRNPEKPVVSRDLIDERAQVSRWLDQIQTARSSTAARTCLVKFMQRDRACIPLTLDIILERGLEAYRPQSKPGDVNSCDNLFIANQADPGLGLVGTQQSKDACLRLVNNWDILRSLNFNMSLSDLTRNSSWTASIHATKYLSYLFNKRCTRNGCLYGYSVTDDSVFSTFWITLNDVYRSTSPTQKAFLAQIIKAYLAEIGGIVSRSDLSLEMDTFYRTLENDRNVAQTKDSRDPQLATLLDDIINSRSWP